MEAASGVRKKVTSAGTVHIFGSSDVRVNVTGNAPVWGVGWCDAPKIPPSSSGLPCPKSSPFFLFLSPLLRTAFKSLLMGLSIHLSSLVAFWVPSDSWLFHRDALKSAQKGIRHPWVSKFLNQNKQRCMGQAMITRQTFQPTTSEDDSRELSFVLSSERMLKYLF